jgi:hypothetical protein
MKMSIKSTNYPEISKNLLFIERKNEILISTEDGNEIAVLKVEIMDKEVESVETESGSSKSKWIRLPTKSWCLTFCPKVYHTCRDSADVIVEE